MKMMMMMVSCAYSDRIYIAFDKDLPIYPHFAGTLNLKIIHKRYHGSHLIKMIIQKVSPFLLLT
jgi:hypothetical protein